MQSKCIRCQRKSYRRLLRSTLLTSKKKKLWSILNKPLCEQCFANSLGLSGLVNTIWFLLQRFQVNNFFSNYLAYKLSTGPRNRPTSVALKIFGLFWRRRTWNSCWFLTKQIDSCRNSGTKSRILPTDPRFVKLMIPVEQSALSQLISTALYSQLSIIYHHRDHRHMLADNRGWWIIERGCGSSAVELRKLLPIVLMAESESGG